MAISIDWETKIISIPKSYMTLIQASPEIRGLNLNTFRLDLKDLEDDAWGMPFPDTHRHNTEVTLGGITLARTLEIINGYTVTFENGQYAVEAKEANSNIADVMNVNQVSLRTFNSAGLITVTSGSGLSTEEHTQLMSLPGLAEIEASTVLAKEATVLYVSDVVVLLKTFVTNKKYLQKTGLTWYLIIRDSSDNNDILNKALKDKNGDNITDIQAGILAQELASSV